MIRWGFIGSGGMAAKLAADMSYAPGNVVAGVAARDRSRAEAFAARFGGAAFDTYEALVTSPDVDVIHVATTNPFHVEHALLAIEGGKAVLVEKPVALNASGARTIFDAARTKGVFAMDGMWMLVNPLVLRLQELVASGAIGEVRSVRAEWGLGRTLPPEHRVVDPANGGGALLDIGIYVVTWAYALLGRPDAMDVAATLASTGVDETVALQWRYSDGRDAQLWTSVPVQAPGRATVRGTEGWIDIVGRFHRPSGLLLGKGDEVRTFDDPIAGQGVGFGPQIAHVAQCLRDGLTESPIVRPADTLAIMELLDDIRVRMGVVYPGE